MGIDANYQALPDGCSLIGRAKRDMEFGWFLALVPYEFEEQARDITPPWHQPARRRDRRRRTRTAQTVLRDPPELREYKTLIREIIIANPGIETRNCVDGSRAWDALHYVLSEERRRGHWYTYGDDIGSKALMGSQSIAPHVHGGQVGAGPVRFLPSADVFEVAAHLELTQPGDLRWWYDPAQMIKHGVYKVYSVEDSEETWDWIVQFYLRLRVCYLAAATHGEGMLITFV